MNKDRFIIKETRSNALDEMNHVTVQDTARLNTYLYFRADNSTAELIVSAMNTATNLQHNNNVMYNFLKATIGQARLDQLLADFK